QSLCRISHLCRTPKSARLGGTGLSPKNKNISYTKCKDTSVPNVRLDFHMTQRILTPVRFLDGLTGFFVEAATTAPEPYFASPIGRSSFWRNKETFMGYTVGQFIGANPIAR
ncbi:MAG: hypothetical protein ACM3SP_15165, partial [Chloroflexota bacterium]